MPCCPRDCPETPARRDTTGMADGARSGSLTVVLCGAGVSVAPPAAVPSWWGFNQAVLAELRRRFLTEHEPPKRANAALRRLSLDDLDVAEFSQLVSDAFAGATWFEVLDALDGSSPNANHDALAAWAGDGSLRAVVTTNFDTLIERALHQAGVTFRVYDALVDDIPPRSESVLMLRSGAAWLDNPMVEADTCGLALTRLLEAAGKRSAAQALRTSILARVRRRLRGGLNLTGVTRAAHQIGQLAGDEPLARAEQAIYCLGLASRGLDAVLEHLPEESRSMVDVRLEVAHNKATIMSNIAYFEVLRGRLSDASSAIAEASKRLFTLPVGVAG